MKQPHESELLKAYCAFVIGEAPLAVASFFLQPKTNDIAAVMNQTAIQKGLGTLVLIYSIGLFIFSIVAWVKFRKEQWSWKIKLLPKLRVIIPILAVIVGGILSARSVATFMATSQEFDPNTAPTPEQLQVLIPTNAIALSYISLGVTVALGIYALAILLQLLQHKNTPTLTPTEQRPQ